MNQQRSNPTWPQLLTAHQGWLSAVIFARVRDKDAVEEILQETALAVVKGDRPTDVDGLNRWLYRVAIRQSVLYRRKQGRNEKKTNGYTDVALRNAKNIEVTSNPLTVLMATERAELVNLAMNQLSNADCEVLLLKYTEHWSCREMATRLGVSYSAIKSRLLRARGNLRKELLQLNESWEEQ